MSKTAMPILLLALALAQSPDPAELVRTLGAESRQMARVWLRSPDARTRAWGAYLAVRDRRIDLINDLVAIVDGYIPAMEISVSIQDSRDSMMAVLDALIELQASIPAHDVAKIYSGFPVQSLLLAPRASPRQEIVPFLLTVFESEQHNPGAWQSAGNFLADWRAPGLGAAVLKSMTIRATLIVAGPEGRIYRRGGMLGDCPGPPPLTVKTGWPGIGWYDFATGRRSPDDQILAPGADPVYFRRTVEATYAPAVTCFTFPNPNLVREHYIATLLNRPIADAPIRHEVTQIIPWSNEDQFRTEVASFVAREKKIFVDVAAQFHTSDHPELIVEIWDQRREKTPLPDIESQPGVTFTQTR